MPNPRTYSVVTGSKRLSYQMGPNTTPYQTQTHKRPVLSSESTARTVQEHPLHCAAGAFSPLLQRLKSCCEVSAGGIGGEKNQQTLDHRTARRAKAHTQPLLSSQNWSPLSNRPRLQITVLCRQSPQPSLLPQVISKSMVKQVLLTPARVVFCPPSAFFSRSFIRPRNFTSKWFSMGLTQ